MKKIIFIVLVCICSSHLFAQQSFVISTGAQRNGEIYTPKDSIIAAMQEKINKLTKINDLLSNLLVQIISDRILETILPTPDNRRNYPDNVFVPIPSTGLWVCDGKNIPVGDSILSPFRDGDLRFDLLIPGVIQPQAPKDIEFYNNAIKEMIKSMEEMNNMDKQ